MREIESVVKAGMVLIIVCFAVTVTICIISLCSVDVDDEMLGVRVNDDGTVTQLESGMNWSLDGDNNVIQLPKQDNIMLKNSININNEDIFYDIIISYNNILNDETYGRLKMLDIAVKSDEPVNTVMMVGKLPVQSKSTQSSYKYVNDNLRQAISAKTIDVVKAVLTAQGGDVEESIYSMKQRLLDNLEPQLNDYGISNLQIKDFKIY